LSQSFATCFPRPTGFKNLLSRGISYAVCQGMALILLFLLLMFGAVVTMPIWGYSAKWKLYPCSACFGLATIGALLVVAGLI
jgi:hypothetical protein